MTYDYPSKSLGPVAPLPWVTANIDYLLQTPLTPSPVGDDLPLPTTRELPQRILMGLNMYGYAVDTATDVRPTDAQRGVYPIVAKQYLDMLTKKNVRVKWHAQPSEHSVDNGHTTAYYPTLHSIELRLHFATERRVGVALWELGQGLDYFYNLL